MINVVSSITYVQKAEGSLRICLDPKDLNSVSKRGQHHIPESQLLTTFNSPFGRFSFKRLPFGLQVSQDIFQRSIDGLDGAVSICDDITVYGANEEEHEIKGTKE